MASSVPLQIAETIQTAHIKRDPSPHHDLAPSTAADKKVPVELHETKHPVGDELDDEDEIPYSVIKPRPRRASHLPPLPDLRFEQSYLHSIANADTWWKVVWVTARDQIMMPFAQGVLYNLALCGWQFWNRNAQLSGNSVGARVRRWWYGVNNWAIPREKIRPVRTNTSSILSDLR